VVEAAISAQIRSTVAGGAEIAGHFSGRIAVEAVGAEPTFWPKD
jgi:hypothetical protein